MLLYHTHTHPSMHTCTSINIADSLFPLDLSCVYFDFRLVFHLIPSPRILHANTIIIIIIESPVLVPFMHAVHVYIGSNLIIPIISVHVHKLNVCLLWFMFICDPSLYFTIFYNIFNNICMSMYIYSSEN